VVKQLTTSDESNATPWGTLLKMTVGVGVVAVAWVVVARYVGRKSQVVGPSNLGVEASLPIDSRCVLHLVRVGERRLLVGSDSAGVKAVVELPGGVIGPVRMQVPLARGGEALDQLVSSHPIPSRIS
jgi:flagellar biogenesis protein FliO